MRAPTLVTVPTGVVTLTSTVEPFSPAGTTAVIRVLVATVKLVAAVAPNVTEVVLVNPVPIMTTLSPPASEAVFGLIRVIVGAGSEKL